MINSHYSVPGPGLEPGWVAPTVFETVASTDSAIRAFVPQRYDFFRTHARRHCILLFSGHVATQKYLGREVIGVSVQETAGGIGAQRISLT